ncbi:MAG: carbohydrate ABC transporter permease [Bifidobacteriaceae bacterium]|jgi:raffinose/stachyose/melibiose transport system permease protein|nr:carbohydrate ABC transporter permease [Bifidobacteriaceae bacterium]
MNMKRRISGVWTVIFAIISVIWMFPILMVIMNSFKKKTAISISPFAPPTKETFAGLSNYAEALEKTDFLWSFVWSLFITVGSVLLMLVFTVMCAWWIVRANNVYAKFIYLLFLISMVVPFQMVMFPLSKMSDMAGLNTPWGLWLLYLGFSPGLPVFIFTGVVKSLPSAVEEAAMIDGASVPRIFFNVVLPLMRSSIVSVAILQTMWVWNDFLLPYVTLDLQQFKTIPIAVQVFKGSYGTTDWGAMMGCLVLTIIPILVFYMLCQKQIISGITAGAVKG